MKRLMWLMPLALLAVVIAGALVSKGHAGDDPKTQKPRSDRIAEQWRFPGALEAGISNHPTNPSLQLEDYVVKQPFGKVWEFYAQKCGHEKPYREAEAEQIHGKDKHGGKFIVHDRLLNGRRWAYFAYQAELYTVAVTVIPAPDAPDHTSIAVTVGIP
jgi:hypothetical protein